MDEYTVTVNGIEHTMLLDDEDAKRYGDNAKKVEKTATKKAAAPANKSAS